MNDEFRQMVIEALRRGETLPAEWAPLLFPAQKREYELTYAGKAREEEIIASTLAVPLQPERTFGTPPTADAWRNMLIFGDNLQAMKTLLEMKQAGKLCNADGTPGVRLVYIDPPFATKQDFGGSQDQKAYQDKVTGAEFIEFLRQRFILLRELMADDGFLVLHIDYRYGHYLKVVLDEVFSGGFRNDIKVPRGTKNVQNQFDEITALAVGDDSLLLYAKRKSSKLPHLRIGLGSQAAGKWDTFWRGTDRPTMRYRLFDQKPDTGQWRWKESRAKKAKENYESYVREFSNDEDLDSYFLRMLGSGRRLDFIRLSGDDVVQYYVPPRDSRIANIVWTDVRTIGKVTSYPTEKHEELLSRVVNWLSRHGDIVLDAFAGSGTTCAVAEKLGRRWIGIDCGKLAIYTIQKRLLSIREGIGQKGKPLTPQPFTLYNAGLYDFSTLRQLPWQDWRFFALQLFGCRDEPHTIGGLALDGKRQGASVLVFDHLRQPGKRIDEETIQSIHAAVGDKVGNRFFIIAPRGVFDFQQDYLDLEGVRYYALRIPYSFINELHQREFTALRQPADENDVNAIVDAVGFDFIRPPEVTWTAGMAAPVTQDKRSAAVQPGMLVQACLHITGFASRAMIRGQDTRGGLETLSLVLVDLDYDGDLFVADQVHFAAELKANDRRIWMPPEAVGAQNMVVCIDIFGNEAREIVTAEQFDLS